MHFVLALFFAQSSTSFGQAGTLDNSYNGDGIAQVSIPGLYLYSPKIALQSDGRAVLGCRTPPDQEGAWLVIFRLGTNGLPDPDFGDDGRVLLNITDAQRGFHFTVLDDDKILVVVARPTDYSFLRFTADGELDTAFGDNGWFIHELTPSGPNIKHMAIDSDGSIVLAASGNFSPPEIQISKFHSDGSRDLGFGTNGVRSILLSEQANDVGQVIIGPDHSITMAATKSIQEEPRLAIIRLTQNGAFDLTFGNGGIAMAPLGEVFSEGHTIGLRSDGKIIAGGVFLAAPSLLLHMVTRLMPDGSLDESYGTNGASSEWFTDAPLMRQPSMTLQPDGAAILVDNTCCVSQDFDIALFRFGPDGQVESTFTSVQYTDIENRSDVPTAVLLQHDGKILVSGSSYQSGDSKLFIARFLNSYTVGIDERLSDRPAHTVYPQPTAGPVSVLFDWSTPQPCTITLHDSQGRLVHTLIANKAVPPGAHLEQFDMSGLAMGPYQLVLRSDAGILATARVMKF